MATASSSNRKVKIAKIKAIDYVEFDMPENDGGVRLFRGPNGAGKTTALLCLNALLGKKVNLSPKDDAPKGTVEGLGVSLTVQKRSAAKGEIEVPNLEGRFDFSDLVDPPIKDSTARNKARIHSLVGLTGGEATPADFYELFGGKEALEGIIDPAELPDSSDVLEMADAIKKSAEAAARVQEARLINETAEWQVAVADSKGHQPDQEPPSVKQLAGEYSAAQSALLAAEEAVRADAAAREHNASLAQKLEQHKASKPTLDIDKAMEILNTARATVADLEAKLATAKATVEAAKQKFDEAHRWEERLAELETSMQKVASELPDLEPLQAAEQAALDRLESAEETKRRYEAAVKAKQLGDSITQRTEVAARLREAAKRTNEIVTKKLPSGCPLQVKDNVLCAYHDKRQAWIAFDELSEGERWRASLHIAIAAVGPGGIIPVRQEAWQSLDKDAADWVAKQCAEAKVYVVSGAVGDGALRVENYTPA